MAHAIRTHLYLDIIQCRQHIHLQRFQCENVGIGSSNAIIISSNMSLPESMTIFILSESFLNPISCQLIETSRAAIVHIKIQTCNLDI
uniref:Uncharacterized protein n=1 Tax=Arundo donax TaxID=35708 RepID=A0A0A9EQS9_ARUDO